MLILKGPEQPVTALAFAPDATALYATHFLGGVQRWDLADRAGRLLETADGQTVYGEFALHPGGRWAFGSCRFATPPTDNMSRVIDLQTGESQAHNFDWSSAQSLAAAPGDDRLATIGMSHYDADRPAAPPCKRLYGWTMTPAGPQYAWHRDVPLNEDARCLVRLGERLATADVIAPAGVFVNNSGQWRIALTIRSAAGGAPEAQIDFPERQIQQLLASPDGRRLVGRLGTALWAWDATDPTRPPVAVGGVHKHWMTPLAAAFHPSGPYLLLANDGPSVIAFDVATWEQVRKWNWKAGNLRAVAVSADGTLAAAAGPRGQVVVWDLDL